MTRIVTSFVVFLLASHVVAAEHSPLKVTFQQLMANPAKFVGNQVDVTGYCHTSNEEISLAASKRADERNQGCENSIWLDVFTSQAKNAAKIQDLEWKMVRVIGTFRYQPRPILDKSVSYEWRFRGFGSYKMWAREITHIVYFQRAQ